MKLDDFESVFRSAVKARFHLQAPVLESVLVVTDMPEGEATELADRARAFLSASLDTDAITWRTVCKGEYDSVRDLTDLIESASPDMIISYRHLFGRDKDLLHSLGSFVDTITQVARPPVLLLPPPVRSDFADLLTRLERVLVVTDHLVGDDSLVNWGVHLCPARGTVVLAHVEDDATFQRYVELLGMIPDVDTELIEKRLRNKLLGRPADYIESIIAALKRAGIEETVTPEVTMGHALSDYQRIIDDHAIDLVVLHTKAQDQLAMHGMAYAISVEIQDTPLLLL